MLLPDLEGYGEVDELEKYEKLLGQLWSARDDWEAVQRLANTNPNKTLRLVGALEGASSKEYITY